MNTAYTFQPMMTCIGNKRKLVPEIYNIINTVRQQLNKQSLRIADAFTGSSVVARALLSLSDILYVNDMELYSYIMAQCFLQPPSAIQISKITNHISAMNTLSINGPYIEGIITRLYAPKNTVNIQPGERCFYTRENALIIDTLRKYIEECVESDIKQYCLAPLLVKASIHTNTAGVFKGFYKCGGIGCFGGKGKNALERIMAPIRLDVPIWDTDPMITIKSVVCFNGDILTIIKEWPAVFDIIYLDPPYNQHPYSSNYFMLNVIATNKEPDNISTVSGIPKQWNKSDFNYIARAVKSMKELIQLGLSKSKYLLISYNDEGIISYTEWMKLLQPYTFKQYTIPYNTYRGSRNLENRSTKINEIMYLVNLKE